MTTTTTANPEIRSAAADAAAALRRLFELAREDCTLVDPLDALDALTSADGPLNVLSEQLGTLDAYLSEYEREDDNERDGIDDARDYLATTIDNIDDAITHLSTAMGCLREMA
jgi:hypothetical protein